MQTDSINRWSRQAVCAKKINFHANESSNCNHFSSYSKEPMFVKKPRSSEACEGDTVIIVCEVVGDPKPEIIWLRDFLKVSKNDALLFVYFNLRPFNAIKNCDGRKQSTVEKSTLT